jgi:methionyl-tRNA formyltransferase
MRIVIIGQSAFGAKALEALSEKDETVVAVFTPPDAPGGPRDPLKEAAIGKGIPVYQPKGYREEKVFEAYKELQPDLTILAFVTVIIPQRFFDAPSGGAICYHPSLLPRHRGGSAISWAVIMGDTKTGVSIFWPDGGIDTGPVLLQKEVEIGPDDTTGSLYFNHLFPMGIEAIVDSVELIKAGSAPRIPQDESKATYEPLCNDKVAAIDWSRPAHEVYNLIRGCDPQPGAYLDTPRGKIRFYQAGLRAEKVEKSPGTILSIDQSGIHVAAPGGVITLGKVRPEKGGKMLATEYANTASLKVGYHLGQKT